MLTGRSVEGTDRKFVLGRKNHKVFEGFWPHLPADNPDAQSMNGATKSEASRMRKTLEW